MHAVDRHPDGKGGQSALWEINTEQEYTHKRRQRISWSFQGVH